MDLLEGYEYLDLDEGAPYMRVFEHGVTFSKGVCERLGYPEKVIFRVDGERCKCALQGVDVNDPRGMDFYSLQDMTRETITWRKKELARELADLAGWEICGHEYIAKGYNLPEEDAMMFDLKTATQAPPHGGCAAQDAPKEGK